MTLRAIDICCGAGGWACAARGTGIEIVAAYDCWDVACETYQLNHPGVEVRQADLTDPAVVNGIQARYSHVDIVLGGIPCQWLSAYRRVVKVRDEEIERGRMLIDACLEIVRRVEPRWWCMENVIGMDKELPLTVPRQVLNARTFCGQRRKRMYAGFFPHVASGDDQRVSGDYHRRGPFRVGRAALAREVKARRMFSDRKSILGVEATQIAHTVIGQSSRHDAEIVVVDPDLPGGRRAWEWQELASLQGFPDDYVFVGAPSNVMQMIGNAVQIDTARAILTAMVAVANKGTG